MTKKLQPIIVALFVTANIFAQSAATPNYYDLITQNQDSEFNTHKQFNSNNSSAANNNLDKAVFWNLDNQNDSLKIIGLGFCSYDTINSFSSILYKTKSNGFWEDYSKHIYLSNSNFSCDSTLFWNGTNWVNIDWKRTTIYDSNGNTLTRTEQHWNGTGWYGDGNGFKKTYTYDTNNNQLSYLYQNENGIGWLNYNQNLNTYDASNNLINTTYQTWTNNNWRNSNKKSSYYNSNNKILCDTSFVWDTLQSVWNYTTNIYYTYINNNLSIRQTQGWNGTAWGLGGQTTYTYDSNNNVIYECSIGTFSGDSIINTYDSNNNLICKLKRHSVSMSWENYGKESYTYDANNNNTSYQNYFWYSSAWCKLNQTLSSFDVNNNLINQGNRNYVYSTGALTSADSTVYYFNNSPQTNCSASFVLQPDTTTPHHWFAINQSSGAGPISFSWNWGDGSTFSTGASPSHTYSAPDYYNICLEMTDVNGCVSSYCDSSTYITRKRSNNTIIAIDVINQTTLTNNTSSIVEQKTHKKSISIFPNPASQKINIQTKSANSNIKIFDALGQIVMQQKLLANNSELSIEDLKSGVYFIEITNAQTTERAKFMKE